MTGADTFITITGPRLLLRDPRVEDVYAEVRWSAVDTAWQDWDAPWEGKGLMTPEEAMRVNRSFTRVTWPLPTPRAGLRIQMIGGPLLGWVNAYHHDPAARTVLIGICICESSYWGRGLGTEAFRLWMDYQFTQRGLACLYTATWSGNLRMVRVAEKCGFSLTNREVGKREVRGGRYDGLTFALTREQWMERKGAR
jgi:RimJ/RimL family protein N-acetyltransferase